jgi:pyruvate/2-oxoglutarate dehydrogenase complex dihydrolipoamide acyltransferase (E2) component
MFGMGAGWDIPVSNHTLQLTLGSVSEKPCVVDDQIEIRKVMSVTVSFDHDVVDGAPTARFIHQLKKLVENGYKLAEQT